MDRRSQSYLDERHRLNMEQSLQELQQTIREYQQEVSRLQGQAQNSRLSESKRAPLEVMRVAFDEVSNSKPFVPSSASVLPALIALRKTHETIAESRAYLATQSTTLDQAKRQLETEQAVLRDQNLLTKSLENRVQYLRNDLESQKEMAPDQVVKERLDELRRKKKNYDREVSRLMKSLNQFIDDHLAAQLAAEDLGGPVVGDMMDIDSDDLAAGFNAQGRPKKAKGQRDQDNRQQRLEDVWGQSLQQQGLGERTLNETAAAAQEMRELTEKLLNQLLGAQGDNLAAYIWIPKETAATRFLVRSKVAQFHPSDSTRIKLIDFGRELDD